MTSDVARYHCDKCGSRFIHEQRFIKHHCKQMKREELFKEPIGQAAWLFYQKWMKSYNKIAPNAGAFLHSKYFNTFVKFAQFVKSSRMVDSNAFVMLMREHDISPMIWTNDQVYALYLEYIDKKLPPERHAEITINTLFDYCEDNCIDVENVFEHLTPNELIQMLRERRVSPWILLNSTKFTTFFTRKTLPEHRIILESIIRPQYWKQKFAAKPEDVKRMKAFVSEMKL